jgi:IS30 family transposase/NAD(P)-dependent dehydrogenase (short-subunit alcohol dehydrogenase family)
VTNPPLTLSGRVVLLTGVSRHIGIGAAIARGLAARGADLFLASWPEADAVQPWGASPHFANELVDALRARGTHVGHLAVDLGDPSAPATLFDAAVAEFGHVDALVANHARSSNQDLANLTAAELDACFAVNTRASLLLAQQFAARHDDRRTGGRIVLFTSGQHLGAMPDELPYVVSKGAIQQVTASLAMNLAHRGITVNCVNPGPTDTGWATPEVTAQLIRRLHEGRHGQRSCAHIAANRRADSSDCCNEVWILEDVSMPGSRLRLDERAQIAVLYGQGLRFGQIAAVIGRDRSTVWREVRRHRMAARSGRGNDVWHPRGRAPGYVRGPGYPASWGEPYRHGYSHTFAQRRADERARRPRTGKLRPRAGAPMPPLWQVVKDKLAQRWSPMQIARWLRAEYPEQPERWVSHETIYQAIYFQARGGMRQELARQVALRSGRPARRAQSRAAQAGRDNKPWVRDWHISSRPAEAADRAVPGHWEGDLVIGARGASAIITLVERRTRYVMLGALPHGRVSQAVIDVLIELMRRLPAELRKTLTWDQGAELARHAAFTLATDCQVFFCDPHSPWQRGSNENTNGLLRQYFPRSSTDFRKISQAELDAVARELNGRPRQTLEWHNPAERLNDYIVATTA